MKKFQAFDCALVSAYFLYETIVEELSKIGIEDFAPKDLRKYSQEFAANCDAIAERLNRLKADYRSILW